MENKELEKKNSAELNDDALENVNGGRAEGIYATLSEEDYLRMRSYLKKMYPWKTYDQITLIIESLSDEEFMKLLKESAGEVIPNDFVTL